MSWYKAGTVSVTNGSAVVTGTGTAFVANVKVGDAFVGPDDRSYEIVTVNSNTSLTISPSYLGSNQSGQSYRIQPTNGITVDLTNSVQSLIATYSGVLAGAGTGQFGDGTVSVPGIRFTSDQDTGFRRSAANRFSAVTGGVDRMTWRENGDVGIGTTSPGFSNGSGLEIERAGVAALRVENTVASAVFELLSTASGTEYDVRGSGKAGLFKYNGTEVWRYNSSGISIGGVTNTPGVRLDVSGYQLIRDENVLTFGSYVAGLSRGPWLAYNSGGNYFAIVTGYNLVETGPEPCDLVFGVASGSTWTSRLRMTNSTFEPSANNFMSIGTGAARYKDLYLVNAPNVSSDERLKNWQRSTLTEAEIAAGERILGELGFFQWLDMIAEKGVENARWHFGALAQEVVRIFIDEGVEAIDPALLDIEPDVFVPEEDRPSMRQAFLTFDTWEAAYEDDVLVRPAGNVFGFRPEQLAFFLLRVSHELRLRDRAAAELRMDALEQRIAVLEGV